MPSIATVNCFNRERQRIGTLWKRRYRALVITDGGPAGRLGTDRSRMTPTTVASPAAIAETFTPEETRALAPYFTNTDRPVVVADQPARDGQRRAVRTLLAVRQIGTASLSRRVPRSDRCRRSGPPTQAAGRTRRRSRARRPALRARAQRVRRRLGGAARRRTHRLRRRLQRPDEGARVGTPDGVPRAVDALRAVYRSAGRPLEVPRAGRARRHRRSGTRSSGRSTRLRDLRPLDPGDGGAFPRQVPAIARRFRRRLQVGDSREGARHAARSAAGRDHVQCRPLRYAARRSKRCCSGCSRIRSRRSATVRAADAGRAAPRDSRVPRARRSADRGGRWIDYFANTRSDFDAVARPFVDERGRRAERRGDAHRLRSGRREQGRRGRALLRRPRCPTISCSRSRGGCRPTIVRRCSAPTSATRGNRRHKPGRAFERTSYRFDVLADYGAFRDLQRHRLLTLEWQPLGTRHGCTEPAADRGGGRARGLASGHGAVRRPVRAADRGGAPRGRAVRAWSWRIASASTWT